jgi:iron(III) transport system ATP-binding protein
VVIRPEWVRLHADASGPGVVHEVSYFGHDQVVAVGLDDGSVIRSRLGASQRFGPDDRVSVEVDGEVLAFPGRADRATP